MHSTASTLATLILPIARALRLQGVDPMSLFDRADIDPAMVINADRRIPASKMRVLWQLAEEATGDEAFGLQAAEQLQPATLQGLGLAVLGLEDLVVLLAGPLVVEDPLQRPTEAQVGLVVLGRAGDGDWYVFPTFSAPAWRSRWRSAVNSSTWSLSLWVTRSRCPSARTSVSA